MPGREDSALPLASAGEVRLLGPLELRRPGGGGIELPRSRKTRALLVLLVAGGEVRSRSRLCDLLWPEVDDPRANLRWSLAKLRPALTACGAAVVRDGDTLRFDAGRAAVDLAGVESLAAAPEAASEAELRRAAGAFRGDLAEGLALSEPLPFEDWLRAERERLRLRRLAILDALVGRLSANPERALPHAFARLAVEPLCVRAQAHAVHLLVAAGRRDEAADHGRRARRLLARELGSGEMPELDLALAAAEAPPAVAPAATSPAPRPWSEVLRELEAAYRSLPPAARPRAHAAVARTLARTESAGPGGEAAVAHFRDAERAGDAWGAALAAGAAARHHLRGGRWSAAAALAERGLALAADLPADAALAPRSELLEVYLHPGLAPLRPPDLADHLRRLAAAAEDAGLPHRARAAWYLVALFHYQGGRGADAERATLAAERAGRAADPATACRALADTAHCLALLERDMDRVEGLLRESEELARQVAAEPWELPLARGSLRHFDGDLAGAAAAFHRAGRLAERGADLWREHAGVERQVMIELERRRPARVLARSRRLAALAEPFADGGEAPFAAALAALARLDLGRGGTAPLDAALAALRRADSRARLAYALSAAGERALTAGDPATAHRHAAEAVAAAEAVERPSEAAVARALLATVDAATGDAPSAVRRLAPLAERLSRPRGLSARARRAVTGAAAAAVAAGADPAALPTPLPTPVS